MPTPATLPYVKRSKCGAMPGANRYCSTGGKENMNYIDHNKMEKVKVDKQFSLKVKDFLKGIYLAVIVPLLVTILEVIQAGSFNLDWESLGKIGASALA